MSRLRRLVGLSTTDKLLLIEALLYTALMSFAVRLLSARKLGVSSSEPSSGATATGPESASAKKIGWLVSVASRYVPGASCLVQALATQALLARRHISSRIRIGVAKGQEGALQAHAWLECGSVIVIGGANLERYTLLGKSNEKISHWGFCNG